MKTKLFFLVVLLAGYTGLSAQLNGNVLKVEGEAVVYETPENMNINIPISVQEENYAKCVKQVNDKYNKLVTDLGKIAIDKSLIQTSNYGIHDEYSYVNNERKHNGYAGLIEVNIEKQFDTNVLNNIINLLNTSDSKPSYDISFKLSPQQKEKLKKTAIETAIADANTKATIITESLGLKMGTIKEINFNYPTESNSQIRTEKRMIQGELAPNQQLTPRLMEIRETIDIVWQVDR